MEISSDYQWERIRKARKTSRTHPAPLRFYAELFVEHSPSDVWSYFTDLASWRHWSPICRGCRLDGDHDELRLGSVLEISFAVMGITMTVPVRIVQFDPPTSITWLGQRFGINASHTYRFTPYRQGTLLSNEEKFSAVGFPLRKLIAAWYGVTKLSEESLEGIERELLQSIPR